MCCAPRTTHTRHARCVGATRCARQGRESFTLTSHLRGRADQTSPPRGKRERLSQARLERYTPTWWSNRGPLPACLLTRPAHQLLRAGCALGQGPGSGARGTRTRQDEGNCCVRRELEERGHEATHEDRGALAAHGLDKAVPHTRVERLLAGCGLGHVLHARLDDVERVRHTCSCVRHSKPAACAIARPAWTRGSLAPRAMRPPFRRGRAPSCVGLGHRSRRRTRQLCPRT